MAFDTHVKMDFAIPVLSWHLSGREIELKETHLVHESEAVSNFTCMLSGRSVTGSGVIISKRDNPIIVSSQEVRHLILTAGHVIGTQTTNEKCHREAKVCFQCDSYKGTSFKAILLNDYSNWDSVPLKDPINGWDYILPNDLALLALENCDNPLLIDIQIADFISEGETVWAAGYPLQPLSLSYCAPIYRNEIQGTYTSKINKAFHNFLHKVRSNGEVLNGREVNYGLASNYSSTSGFSGGPVYRKDGDEYGLVGINLGGAVAPNQYDLGQVISNIRKEKWRQAAEQFNRIDEEIKSNYVNYYNEELEELVLMIKRRIKLLRRDDSIQLLIQLTQMLALWVDDLSVLNHNMSFPCYHDLMRQIKNIARRFKMLQVGRVFNSYPELWAVLKQE